LSRRLLTRTAFFWLFVRAVMPGLAALTPSPMASVDGILVLRPITSVGVVGVVLAMVFVDVTIMRERLFYENLGVGRVGVLRVALVAVAALELGTSFVARTILP
jgi:hypothetical protein